MDLYVSFLRLGEFSAIISSNKISVPFSPLFGPAIMYIFVLWNYIGLLSHLHSFSFLLLWINSTVLSWSSLIPFAADLVFYWTLSLNFPVQLHSLQLHFCLILKIFFLFVEILILFMHCSPDLSEHVYDYYFKFSIR